VWSTDDWASQGPLAAVVVAADGALAWQESGALTNQYYCSWWNDTRHDFRGHVFVPSLRLLGGSSGQYAMRLYSDGVASQTVLNMTVTNLDIPDFQQLNFVVGRGESSAGE
jgi:hypothetical protein